MAPEVRAVWKRLAGVLVAALTLGCVYAFVMVRTGHEADAVVIDVVALLTFAVLSFWLFRASVTWMIVSAFCWGFAYDLAIFEMLRIVYVFPKLEAAAFHGSALRAAVIDGAMYGLLFAAIRFIIFFWPRVMPPIPPTIVSRIKHLMTMLIGSRRAQNRWAQLLRRSCLAATGILGFVLLTLPGFDAECSGSLRVLVTYDTMLPPGLRLQPTAVTHLEWYHTARGRHGVTVTIEGAAASLEDIPDGVLVFPLSPIFAEWTRAAPYVTLVKGRTVSQPDPDHPGVYMSWTEHDEASVPVTLWRVGYGSQNSSFTAPLHYAEVDSAGLHEALRKLDVRLPQSSRGTAHAPRTIGWRIECEVRSPMVQARTYVMRDSCVRLLLGVDCAEIAVEPSVGRWGVGAVSARTWLSAVPQHPRTPFLRRNPDYPQRRLSCDPVRSQWRIRAAGTLSDLEHSPSNGPPVRTLRRTIGELPATWELCVWRQPAGWLTKLSELKI
jgi:hypothetical protein